MQYLPVGEEDNEGNTDEVGLAVEGGEVGLTLGDEDEDGPIDDVGLMLGCGKNGRENVVLSDPQNSPPLTISIPLDVVTL